MKKVPIKLKAGALVLVRWEDSATEVASTNWLAAKKLRDALRSNTPVALCFSSGFVVATNRRCISLAQSVSEGGSVCHVLHIPWSAVRWLKHLKEPKTRVRP
ncbi:hypothetical protein GO986_18740 [Deinococcus sp. HMF7620]|uniref:Uncharacterized protein n=1 Tax=Deinococcus arboris TaxID=2682977 RepID=A0A7C9LX11_9DEIO|nr:hypothetical protein [Deinococcus arboris]MVN88780.1 hypothetical protein [Deinococcus arboris]